MQGHLKKLKIKGWKMRQKTRRIIINFLIYINYYYKKEKTYYIVMIITLLDKISIIRI